tara:strand:- start:255 stop:524 length:270 start_codon:yes stop_codon:yes gene_type:complete
VASICSQAVPLLSFVILAVPVAIFYRHFRPFFFFFFPPLFPLLPPPPLRLMGKYISIDTPGAVVLVLLLFPPTFCSRDKNLQLEDPTRS